MLAQPAGTTLFRASKGTTAGPVGIRQGGPYIEMHAVKLANPDQQHVTRVWGEGDEAEYDCACQLAQSMGIRLEG